jgi:hypothetical protein
MMKATVLALMFVAACHEVSCPAIAYSDGFMLVLADDAWAPAPYKIEVSYLEGQSTSSYRCELALPLVFTDAGAEQDPRSITCQSLGGSGDELNLWVGQELILRSSATPAELHLTVSQRDAVVLDRDVELDYARTYPHGRECGGPYEADVRIDL